MKWQEPPSGSDRYEKNAYEDDAAELRAHPKEWGLVVTFPEDKAPAARHVAYDMKHGEYVAFRPSGSFEAVSRKEKNDEGVDVINVYARYVGGETPSIPIVTLDDIVPPGKREDVHDRRA